MANISKTASEGLTQRQRFAWQMLGYQRWLPRAALRESARAAAEDAPATIPAGNPLSSVPAANSRPNVPAESPPQNATSSTAAATPVNLAQAKAALDVPAQASVAESPPVKTRPLADTDAQPIALEGASLWPMSTLSILVMHDVCWLFPPLCYDGVRYRFFKEEAEALLFSRALTYVGLQAEAGVINALAEKRVKARLPAGHIVDFPQSVQKLRLCGDKALLNHAKMVIDIDEEKLNGVLGCTHPALALRDARYKAQLWADLETIKENYENQ